jgi:hypothetical protein
MGNLKAGAVSGCDGYSGAPPRNPGISKCSIQVACEDVGISNTQRSAPSNESRQFLIGGTNRFEEAALPDIITCA